jgi:hypothetical protein
MWEEHLRGRLQHESHVARCDSQLVNGLGSASTRRVEIDIVDNVDEESSNGLLFLAYEDIRNIYSFNTYQNFLFA